ncbi:MULTISPECIES: CoA pyrophosphatase [Halomonadaceae]|uniref:CoA pyrophosphatase n=1 Tax=Halomonadaceae TaxID=28256 RepID=UPI001581AA19|nr:MULTISPECIES: CoA pyrophosphatase [Halomonas]MDI4638184.1 CoA pyrophosphatase [Halomonas sp. BMC7]NUJ59184.1 CoA pyrophosphatase [Halomonas taeanensis]
MLENLRDRLQAHVPQRLALKMPRAAVLLPIVDRPEPTLLFTRRADHLKQHGGQVAFPGGKWEHGDDDLLDTALREAEEEIALPPDRVQLLGRLSDVISLHGIRVTPYVGLIPADLPLVPELSELDAIFEVPLTHFLEDKRTHTDVIRVDGRDYYVPSYRVSNRTPGAPGTHEQATRPRDDDHVIWGLSAMMLVELLAEGFAMPISLFERPPGELCYRPERRMSAP